MTIWTLGEKYNFSLFSFQKYEKKHWSVDGLAWTNSYYFQPLLPFSRRRDNFKTELSAKGSGGGGMKNNETIKRLNQFTGQRLMNRWHSAQDDRSDSPCTSQYNKNEKIGNKQCYSQKISVDTFASEQELPCAELGLAKYRRDWDNNLRREDMALCVVSGSCAFTHATWPQKLTPDIEHLLESLNKFLFFPLSRKAITS